MSDSKWDDMFKQYSEFEKEPAHDRWGAIASELDKDKKRRFGMWWLFGIGAASTSMALIWLFWLANPEQPQAAEQIGKTQTKREKTLAESGSKTEKFTESKAVAESALPIHSSTPNTQPVPSEPKPSRSGSAGFVAETLTPGLADLLAPSASASTSDRLLELAIGNPRLFAIALKSMEAQKIHIVHQRPKALQEESEPSLTRTKSASTGFVLGIQTSIAYSSFTPSANLGADLPASMSNYLKENLALRKGMESGGYSVSQGIQVGYQFTPSLSLQTGIRLIQTTQVFQYNASTVNTDPLNAPQDLPEGGLSTSPSYQLPFQQIESGSDYRVDNKYYGREIPLSLQYNVKLKGKFRLLGQIGGSYRWISSGILYFPDIDNVGMLSLNNPTDYPGIRSTWHTHLGVGLSYELNHGFLISAMPYFNMALNSNIRFNRFIQQRQQEFGLNISLVRTIRISQ